MRPLVLLHSVKPVVCLWAGLVLVLSMFVRVSSTVSDGVRLRRETDALVAAVLSEEAAWELVTATADTEHVRIARFGYSVHLTTQDRDQAELFDFRAVAPSGARQDFRCRIFEGRPPAALLQRLVLAGSNPRVAAAGWDWLNDATVPEPTWLGDSELRDDRDSEWVPMCGITLSDSVALRWLPFGTDRRDYLWDRATTASRPLDVQSGSRPICVPGNLWILEDLDLRLERPVTVIVEGNLYLDASIRLTGAGRLLICSEAPENSAHWVDLDQDGRRSPGDRRPAQDGSSTAWLEGGGCAYLGIPGERRAAVALRVDATLVVGRDLHLLAPEVEFGDSLVLGSELIRSGPELQIRFAKGRPAPNPNEPIPGFRAEGSPRPGPLSRR